MRHGYIAWANVPATCANPDTGALYDCSYTERHLFSAAGADYGPYWDDGCNPGCKGQAPNLDITPYMTTGHQRGGDGVHERGRHRALQVRHCEHRQRAHRGWHLR
jgi:hypothetical protein